MTNGGLSIRDALAMPIPRVFEINKAIAILNKEEAESMQASMKRK